MAFLQPVTLQGVHAALVPLSHEHLAGLQDAARDGELWKLWYTFIPRPEAMATEIERRLGLLVPRPGTRIVLGWRRPAADDHPLRRAEARFSVYR